MEALELRRVSSSADLMTPGDFCFVEKREPIRRYQQVMTEPPRNFLRRLWWRFIDDRYQLKEIIELRWPEYDAIILNCPHCNQPIATTKEHRILSLDPLTIETPIACAYSRGADRNALPTIAFHVKEGKIMPA